MAMYYVLLNGENGGAYNIADQASQADIKTLASLIAGAKNKKVVLICRMNRKRKDFLRLLRQY